MIDVAQIHSLSDFQRNAKEHIDRLKETGKPEVLTVNGQASVVVQSAEAYQKLLEDADLARSVEVLRQRLAPGREKRAIPADEVLAAVRKKLGLREPR